MTTAAIRPAYAATVTGSKGQVIARFRVKAMKISTAGIVTLCVVLGLAPQSTESRPFVMAQNPYYKHAQLFDANGGEVLGAFRTPSGKIYGKRGISVTAQGEIVTFGDTFGGLWCAAFDQANESARRARRTRK